MDLPPGTANDPMTPQNLTTTTATFAALLTFLSCAPSTDTSSFEALVSVGICGPVDRGTGFAARDSAGIQIVENLSHASEERHGFALSREPVAVIGARESDPDDVIGRLASAKLLADGRTAVADALTLVIRVYDVDGALLDRFGGKGDGPGEFNRSVEIKSTRGDTLVVSHYYGMMYARMLAEGTYLDGGYVSNGPGIERLKYGLQGVFGDGDFLVMERNVVSAGSTEPPKTEVERLDWTAWRLDPHTGTLDSIGPLPRQDYYTVVQQGEFDGVITFGDLPMGRVESWALGDTDIFLGWGDDFEVERRSADGTLTGLIRICEEPVPVDPDDLERAIQKALEPYDGENRRLEEAALRQIDLPTVEPAYLEMLTDDQGRLWVRDFAPAWEDQTWQVFDGGGRWLGSVTTPPGLRVLDIRGDRLLASVKNDLDVETVRVYRLE